MSIFDESLPVSVPEDGTVHKCTSQGEYAGCVQYNAKQGRWLAINELGSIIASYPTEVGAANVVLDKFNIARWRRKKGLRAS